MACDILNYNDYYYIDYYNNVAFAISGNELNCKSYNVDTVNYYDNTINYIYVHY